MGLVARFLELGAHRRPKTAFGQYNQTAHAIAGIWGGLLPAATAAAPTAKACRRVIEMLIPVPPEPVASK